MVSARLFRRTPIIDLTGESRQKTRFKDYGGLKRSYAFDRDQLKDQLGPRCIQCSRGRGKVRLEQSPKSGAELPEIVRVREGIDKVDNDGVWLRRVFRLSNLLEVYSRQMPPQGRASVADRLEAALSGWLPVIALVNTDRGRHQTTVGYMFDIGTADVRTELAALVGHTYVIEKACDWLAQLVTGRIHTICHDILWATCR